jgi:hypothetical protein
MRPPETLPRGSWSSPRPATEVAAIGAIAYLSRDAGVKAVCCCQVLVVEVVCLAEGRRPSVMDDPAEAGRMGLGVLLRGRPCLSGPAAASVGGR